MDFDLSCYPKLTPEQAGHFRHLHNLTTLPDGEWHHMGTQEPMQECVDAYHYQLARTAYAFATGHFNRPNALRSVYKPLFRQVIYEMLGREV